MPAVTECQGCGHLHRKQAGLQPTQVCDYVNTCTLYMYYVLFTINCPCILSPVPSRVRVSCNYCLLSTVYCLLSTVYCLLSTVYCLLSTVYCPLPTVYCTLSSTLLSTVYCLLPTVYCLLSTIYCLRLFCLLYFSWSLNAFDN